jgi:mutator protein MutT
MKRIRAVAIVVKDKEILLMYRKNEKEYYTFPGGGVEEGETIERAVLRELEEETTIKATINKLLYHHIYDDNTEQYFYLCDYITGQPKLREDSIEKEKTLQGNNSYNPLWVKIEELQNKLVYPLEIRDLVIEDYKNNFRNSVITSTIKISELRETL